MKKRHVILAKPLIIALSGFSTFSAFKAHKDLKAPCGKVASNGDNPCGAEVPLNLHWKFEGGRIHALT